MCLNGPFDIFGVDPARAFPHRHPRQEAFAEHLEAHDEVGQHHLASPSGVTDRTREAAIQGMNFG
jgi:hypothetical protein